MMKMNMKAAKNMRGFMCQTPGTTAVCMASEPLSVIVQRRPDRTLPEHARLINNTRLIEPRSHGLASAIRRSAAVSSLALKSDQEKATRRSTNVRSLALESDREKDTRRSTNVRSLALKSDREKDTRRSTDVRSLALKSDQEKASESQVQVASSLAAKDRVFQVVVMRVSLHCQGCAGKVKKHLSKMEGVTSFSIDLESKRVTVMGHVSPMVVVESISKVKRAELWPSAPC
ncbi:hypothetical protein ACH5RR_001986 [Cinchona calisaya]|uniref:HMA domain-containing protein n=1 Tax=Cinchona calisaya TaxID=153742 RepID=A0ABD3B4Z4_9GENT